MKEYQVFIPYGEERIAAAVTVPDEAVRGLVVLWTGLGATRSHRHQIWSRSARRLADVGIASIRWDYLGIGDSSGDIRVWGLAHLPIEQAVAVASFGMRCVGTDRLAVAGNCVGSWCSLALASRMPECIGAALI